MDDQIKLIEQSKLKVENNKNVQKKRNNPMVEVENKSDTKNNKFNNKNIQVISKQQIDGQNQEIEPCQQLQLPTQKQIQEPQQLVSMILNQDKSIPIKEQGISNVGGQEAPINQNSLVIFNSSNIKSKRLLFNEGQIQVTDETINSIIVINENFLLLITEKELFHWKSYKVLQQREHETNQLHKSDQKILNQTLYEKELIFQTQDLKIHHMNLDAERITDFEIRASNNLYSYSRNKKIIQKYYLKLEKLEFDKEIPFQNQSDLIYLKHQHLGLLIVYQNGDCQQYDGNLQPNHRKTLQFKELTDIKIENKYICYVENNKLYLELKYIKTTKFVLPESIKQFSVHDDIQGKVILISCILNNGIFHFIKLDEYGNSIFNSHMLKQCTYQCSAFYQSYNKKPILYLANKGNIIFYRT